MDHDWDRLACYAPEWRCARCGKQKIGYPWKDPGFYDEECKGAKPCDTQPAKK